MTTVWITVQVSNCLFVCLFWV